MCRGNDHLAWKRPFFSETCRGLRTVGGVDLGSASWIRVKGGHNQSWTDDGWAVGLIGSSLGECASQTEVAPPSAMVVVPTSEDAHVRIDRLEQRMRQLRLSDGGMVWDDFDGLLVASLPAKFRMPEIE
ncbi:hypothetical protein CK203_087660 [Vitis vinifera]|uniref:Uncharacterized protein n=1 Tax=Vitis vinifera TaxID=29760 RepID=A0A438C733_VITVI|nr:hypothetical protein CK203_087660 [Vitis vinifera]